MNSEFLVRECGGKHDFVKNLQNLFDELTIKYDIFHIFSREVEVLEKGPFKGRKYPMFTVIFRLKTNIE